MERFLPGRHLIESFGNGGFRLGGVSHQGSLLILPSGVRALQATVVTDLRPEMFDLIIAEKSQIDMVLIGTGADIAPLSRVLRQSLQEEHISFEQMSTNAAVRTYNVVVEEERRVAAILLAVA
jgi:uncharacterized protein